MQSAGSALNPSHKIPCEPMNHNHATCHARPTSLHPLTPALPTRVQTAVVKTQGEIEAEISLEMKKFQIEHLGRGPEDVRVFAIGNLIVVRLVGVLTPAEKHLAAEIDSDRGRNLVKEVRTHIVERARRWMNTMIHNATGANLVSLHHDISTVTGEEIVVFSLDDTPAMREPKRR